MSVIVAANAITLTNANSITAPEYRFDVREEREALREARAVERSFVGREATREELESAGRLGLAAEFARAEARDAAYAATHAVAMRAWSETEQAWEEVCRIYRRI